MKKVKFIVFALCVTAISWGSCNHNSDETLVEEKLVEETPIEEPSVDETPIDEPPFDYIKFLCEYEGRIIIQSLKDEPAYVVKGNFQYVADSICLEVLDKSVWEYLIVPCCEIPQEYKIDGLPVLISGNILHYAVEVVPFPPSFVNGIIPIAIEVQANTHLFEWTSIKLAK